MENPDVLLDRREPAGLSRLKLLLALSRTPHLLLDLATPAVAALFWLQAFPPAHVVILGLITAFAGYTTVYALNDLVDLRTDREKLRQGGFQGTENYLDAAIVRHPMAQGLLSFREGVLWAAGWAGVCLTCAYLLNPVCILFFLAGAVLEVVYCLLWRISPFRTLMSGAVKTCGAVAAVYAVDPNPSFPYVLTLFAWLFFWEIGGQNIPNDWAELEEDTRFNAKTVLVRFGPQWAAMITFACLSVAVFIHMILPFSATRHVPLTYISASVLVGIYLLLLPSFRLLRTKDRSDALTLFRKSSYYPLSLLITLAITIII